MPFHPNFISYLEFQSLISALSPSRLCFDYQFVCSLSSLFPQIYSVGNRGHGGDGVEDFCPWVVPHEEFEGSVLGSFVSPQVVGKLG